MISKFTANGIRRLTSKYRETIMRNEGVECILKHCIVWNLNEVFVKNFYKKDTEKKRTLNPNEYNGHPNTDTDLL